MPDIRLERRQKTTMERRAKGLGRIFSLFSVEQ
jgi:hypothetical protein